MATPVSSVVLLSGGLDSAANLAFCAERDLPVLALTILYSQRAESRELEAARKLAAHYSVPHEVLDLRWLGRMGGSALTDATAAMPELKQDQLDDMSVVMGTKTQVWVPNRNGVFLQVAAAIAERRGAKRVVLGFNREEAATFPDNSRDFMDRSTRALELSTANGVEIFSYTVDLDKREIVRALRGLAKKFPFESLWSCYEGGHAPCNRCESCQRLARALSQA